MTYTPNPTWVDGSGGGTPIIAAALNHIEAGILDASNRATALEALHTANNSITAQYVKIGPTSYAFTPVGVNSAYFVVDKANVGSDASTVYRDGGAIRSEVGIPADDDTHLKTVTGVAGSEVFIDGIIIKNAAPDTGKVYVPVGLGIGTVPVELFHLAANNTTGRVTGKVENTALTGSNGTQFQFAGRSTNFVAGTDVGLNGGSNFFVVNAGAAYMTGFLVDATGHVGILTDSPANALDVNGAVTVRGSHSLQPINICGATGTFGAPTSGTWLPGDAILDVTGKWYYCTVGGTPGTWSAMSLGEQGPEQLNWAAMNMDPAIAPSTSTPSAGTIYYNSVYVTNPLASVGHVNISIITAGVTLANCYLGVFDVLTGNRLGVTADISASLTSVQGVSAALITPITGLVWNQHLYIAVLTGSAGTPPGYAGGRANGGNLGMSSGYRIQVKTGSATSLPTTVSAGLTLPGSGSFQSVGLSA